MSMKVPASLEEWNAAGDDYLPGLLGMRFIRVELDEVVATLEVRRALGAWNGYLHAGTVTSLAEPAVAMARSGACQQAPAGSPQWN
ncbi:hypothetical protein GCM10019059_30000 [Camelimonas fluminis]|uniref:PaaI family thioesterase n=1 Tax=Camelimonas fluminis TaxID=1576911 RepID=A0ABV7UKD5_9HYPH|nr:hypothetical protein [Camelimonas fluminis]GHE68267.1 hypothetical protein GCM10019059_30000 [Camelimonas fluminis]